MEYLMKCLAKALVALALVPTVAFASQKVGCSSYTFSFQIEASTPQAMGAKLLKAVCTAIPMAAAEAGAQGKLLSWNDLKVKAVDVSDGARMGASYKALVKEVGTLVVTQDLVLQLSDEMLVWVLLHEMGHAVYRHPQDNAASLAKKLAGGAVTGAVTGGLAGAALTGRLRAGAAVGVIGAGAGLAAAGAAHRKCEVNQARQQQELEADVFAHRASVRKSGNEGASWAIATSVFRVRDQAELPCTDHPSTEARIKNLANRGK
jgi:Zn-dependent protease with chaperone function